MSIKLDQPFLEASKADWLAKVEKDLKGKPLAGLDWDYGSINGTPFFHRDDITPEYPIYKPSIEGGWEVGFPIEVGDDVEEANEIALEALQLGATNLLFYLPDSFTPVEVPALLKGIQMEWVTTQFELSMGIMPTISKAINQYVGEFFVANLVKVYFRGVEADQLHHWMDNRNDENFPSNVLFHVQSLNRIEDPVTQIAHLVYKWNQILERVYDKGVDLAAVIPNTRLIIRLGDHYFLNIAQLRALRLLSTLVIESWGLTNEFSISIEVQLATDSHVNDTHYNKIKATAQALAAVIGGGNTLFIWPSDALQNKNGNIDSRRVSLNVQHILKLESYLKQIGDPAAGSYFLESLTDQLAKKAWVTFQKMVDQQ